MSPKMVEPESKSDPALSHNISVLFHLWFPICVPDQLKPEPILLAIPDFPIKSFPTFTGVSACEASWPKRFLACREAVLTIFFPGVQTGTTNKPWIEKKSGEKYVETRDIRMECALPQTLMHDAKIRFGVLDVGMRSSAVHYFIERVLQRLLDSMRWRTGQYWIGQQPMVLGVDFASVWTDSAGKKPLGSSGSATDRPPPERSRPLGNVEWTQVGADLRTLEEPPLHEVFLWDAEHALWVDDLMRTILYTTIAVEVFTKRIFKERGCTKDPLYGWFTEHDVESRTPFIQYYDSLAKCLCGRSLRGDQPETFRWLDRLFQARNKIMHEGRSYFRGVSGQRAHDVDLFHIYEMFNAARASIDWLKTASGVSPETRSS